MFTPALLDRSYFPAVVKSAENIVLADGFACISLQERSIDFKGSFVPLFFLNETASICRMVDGKEAECFTGTVYLSSANLLRIIHVDEKLLAKVLAEQLQWVNIPGTAVFTEQVQVRRSLLRRTAEAKTTPTDIQVHAISLSKIKFTAEALLQTGQEVQVTLQEPLALPTFPVLIQEQILFGEKTGYRGDILSLSEESRTKMVQFLSEMQEAHFQEEQ